MRLTVVKSGSPRLVIPRTLAAELGWEHGDVLQISAEGGEMVIENVGKGWITVPPFRRRLGKFGNSLAVTLPQDFDYPDTVEATVEDGKIRIKLK